MSAQDIEQFLEDLASGKTGPGVVVQAMIPADDARRLSAEAAEIGVFDHVYIGFLLTVAVLRKEREPADPATQLNHQSARLEDLARHVREMRELQTQYFKTRDRAVFVAAVKKEQAVDQLLKGQPVDQLKQPTDPQLF